MSYDALKRATCEANLELNTTGLVMGTFGNLSIVDRAAAVFAIKPSGVPYEQLAPSDVVVVSLASGAAVDGALRPSSDTPTHLELYRAFECGAIVHTHSEY
ncbi:MAG TPA: class II aldolase/adducin family protein, partial [Vicinamibacterales bacterium]|nr:class II aldolase/adducin family protein [Vicinamibacterales bacterium]